MSIITDWTEDKAKAFTRENLAFGHTLHERPMFDDEGLASLLDRYPREHLGVFTMGEDPVDWKSWRAGKAGDLSGDQLLDAAKSGRIWLNLRHTNDFLPDYAELEREIFAEKQAMSGVRTFKRDLGMLISSANAQVFYHLDVPLVSLWQLRGRKTVWVYPVADPYIGHEQLERIVLKETAEQFAYEPGWDKGAEAHELTPGKMVTWRQNAPHRIENGPMLNVSLSIEFMTAPAVMRANVLYANGVLRKAGGRPRLQASPHPAALAKVALARGVKAAGLSNTFEKKLPKTFRVAPGQPNAIAPL
ncbi:MAG: hypothetical protein EON94_12885 [Caulobacteraceae bacterium]|nr:MAG: hypothetical protein EON94_12885 [Caulobacteraceae bacterium]